MVWRLYAAWRSQFCQHSNKRKGETGKRNCTCSCCRDIFSSQSNSWSSSTVSKVTVDHQKTLCCLAHSKVYLGYWFIKTAKIYWELACSVRMQRLLPLNKTGCQCDGSRPRSRCHFGCPWKLWVKAVVIAGMVTERAMSRTLRALFHIDLSRCLMEWCIQLIIYDKKVSDSKVLEKHA